MFNKKFLLGSVLICLLLAACNVDQQQSQYIKPLIEITETPIEITRELSPESKNKDTNKEPLTEKTKEPTVTPTVTVDITPVETQDYEESYYIENVYGHRQFFSIGCEAAAAVDWARFFGVEIIEYNFQFELPVSDNPDLGFVGDVRGPWGQAPPYAYGVHAGPIADALRNYGLNAIAVKGFTLEKLKKQISNDKPVIVWVIGNVVGGVPTEYTDSEGNTIIVAAYEHVVIVTGYDKDAIRYLNNGKVYETPVDNFLNSWGVLGNMAVVMGDNSED